MTVRDPTPADVPRIGQIAEGAGLFPAEYVPEMIAPFFNGACDAWQVASDDDGPVGFGYARPEAMTDRTWNILALAVDPDRQSAGHGKRLLATMEAALDARLIIIETTQLPEQAAARAFYLSSGYEKQGHVTDFYGAGEDKIIIRKAMA